MLNDRIREALVVVLVQKIYPFDASLVRNDVKTARLIRDFVLVIDKEYKASFRIKYAEHSRLQQQAWDSREFIEPLIGLSVESLRKYVSLVWKHGDIQPLIKFDKVKSVGL